MKFNTPMNLGDLGAYPFNPFIFTTDRNIEVHLPGEANTALANTNLFGTGKDNTLPGENRYYKTKNNLTWALHLPVEFEYPSEKTSIINAYLKFADWAQSGGTTNTGWYLNETGNRDASKLFTR
jgi:LruC domain-containing protein